MGNHFSQILRDFITNSARSGAYAYNLIRNMILLPLYQCTSPHFYRELQGSGITQWEESSQHIGSVQINWFEDATKYIVYFFCYNSIMDKVLTTAVFQAKFHPARTELFMYMTNPETDEIMGTRFQTGLNIHELRNFFNQMM